MPDETEVVETPVPETKPEVPVMEPSTAEEGPGAPIVVRNPVALPDGDFIDVPTVEYNAGVAEHGNARNFCEAVHGKTLVDAVQKDGFVSIKTGPLEKE